MAGSVFFLFECPSVASKSTDSHTERGPFCSTCKQRVRHTRTHTRTEIEILNSKIGHPVRYDELFTLILEKYYSYVEIRRKSGRSPAEVVRTRVAIRKQLVVNYRFRRRMARRIQIGSSILKGGEFCRGRSCLVLPGSARLKTRQDFDIARQVLRQDRKTCSVAIKYTVVVCKTSLIFIPIAFWREEKN